MGIYRVKKDSNYSVMNNTGLFDSRLSWKAKGILANMLARPDNWMFRIEEMERHASDGEKALRSGLNELKKAGYLQRKPVYQNGKISEWETLVYETPQGFDLLSGFVQVENLQVEKLHVENEALLNTDSTKYLKEPNTKSLNAKKAAPKIKYAEFVSMTAQNYQKLVEKYGEQNTQKFIETLDNYKGSKGKKYNDDYRAILSWVVDKVLGNKQYPAGKGQNNNDGASGLSADREQFYRKHGID